MNRGGLGLSCGPDSLALAGAPLLRRTPTGIAPRSAKELALLLAAAYGREYEEVPRLLTALGVVAVALNAGDLAKAMTTAVMLQLPELDWNGAVRLANAEAVLRKYDPTELRDWHGRWTDSSSEDTVLAVSLKKRLTKVITMTKLSSVWLATGEARE